MARLALTEDHRQAVERWFEDAAARRARRPT
jgi:hypothetical protein